MAQCAQADKCFYFLNKQLFNVNARKSCCSMRKHIFSFSWFFDDNLGTLWWFVVNAMEMMYIHSLSVNCLIITSHSLTFASDLDCVKNSLASKINRFDRPALNWTCRKEKQLCAKDLRNGWWIADSYQLGWTIENSLNYYRADGMTK